MHKYTYIPGAVVDDDGRARGGVHGRKIGYSAGGGGSAREIQDRV